MKFLKKYIAALIMLMCAMCSITANAQRMQLEYDGRTVEYTGSIYKLVVNNRTMDNLPLSPIIFNDRALVPVREIFEELGATVSYNGETRCVEVEHGTTYIRMYINNNMAYVNGKRTTIPGNVVPKLIAEKGKETKTMVPVRFISETIGLSVEFHYESGTIFVESPEALANVNATPVPTQVPTPVPTEEPTAEPEAEVTPKPTKKPQAKPKPTKRPVAAVGVEEGITGATLETEYVMQGVDVSHWQEEIDWKTAKDEIDFAILNLGYGQNIESQDDAYFTRNAAACEKYGIPYGVYIYSYATSPERAAGEAEHVLRVIEDCNLSFPVYYDIEDASQKNLEPEVLGEIAQTFCDIIQAAGYEVGIYASTNWWKYYLTDEAFDNPTWYKWVAQYNTECTYTGKYTMWQYTDSGQVDGIEDDGIDMNYWYGKPRSAK